MDASLARRLWWALEPYHAMVYFAPEARAAYDEAGLKGGWMGYFASRSAAMGPVPPEVVLATFYNFAPGLVRRAIPDAWRLSSPERVLAARLQGAGAALGRLLGDEAGSAGLVEAAGLARLAAEAADPAGRPLFAGHASLPWPREPQLVLWHAATLLREFRGDGHVAALLGAGIDGCEANVLVAAAGEVPAELLRGARGWTQADWSAAAERLEARGLLDAGGAIAKAGRAARARVEAATDELAMPPWRHLGADGCTRLETLLGAPRGRILAGGGFPFPNPIGLPGGVERPAWSG
jgi:hypothetical protein